MDSETKLLLERITNILERLEQRATLSEERTLHIEASIASLEQIRINDEDAREQNGERQSRLVQSLLGLLGRPSRRPSPNLEMVYPEDPPTVGFAISTDTPAIAIAVENEKIEQPEQPKERIIL